jgi:hypothetical protein
MAKRIGLFPASETALAFSRLVGSGGAATIDRGTPTKEGSNGAVAIMVDGNGTTSERFSGIAKSVSTDTAAASGVVEVYLPFPGHVYTASPKTAGAANTVAEIQALGGKRTVFDLTSGDWTIDAGAGDGATNGLVIVGGNPNEDVLYFVVSPTVSMFE